MTRIDKIVKLKARPIDNRIDLHKCSDQELNSLIEITDQVNKPNSKTVQEAFSTFNKRQAFINNLVEKQKAGNSGKPVGRWS